MSSVKARLEELMIRNDLSQSKVAKVINKSGATVSLYLSGKYNGDITLLEADIQQFIEREHKRADDIEIPFVMTPTAKRGIEHITDAHEERGIAVLYGQAGLGKTVMLKKYAHDNPSSVILIQVKSNYRVGALLADICARLNIPIMGNQNKLMTDCIIKLEGSGRLLLVDEAELLPLQSLEALRRIHDLAGVGIVLAGMPKLIVNLKGKRGELTQLYSRVGAALNLGNVLPQEEIRMISIAAIEGVSDRVVDALCAKASGNARSLEKLIKGASRLSRKNRQTALSVSAVEKFSQMLIK